MNVLIQASKNFKDEDVFRRAMMVTLIDVRDGDKILNLYSLGPVNLNSMAQGFANMTENTLRSKGIKIKFHHIPRAEAESRQFDKALYFCNPGEQTSPVFNTLRAKDADVLVFRY